MAFAHGEIGMRVAETMARQTQRKGAAASARVTAFVTGAAAAAAFMVPMLTASAAGAQKDDRIGDFWTWTPSDEFQAPLVPHTHRPSGRRGESGSSGRTRSPFDDFGCRKRGDRAFAVVDDDGGKGVFTEIQSAVCAVVDGGTVFVQPGKYDEKLEISHPVRIKGDVPANAAVDPANRALISPMSGACIRIAVGGDSKAGDLVELESLHFVGSGGEGRSGCVSHYRGNLVMRDVSVTARSYVPAVYLAGGNAILERNTIRGEDRSYAGILIAPQPYVWNQSATASYTIRGNEISQNLAGVIIDAPQAFDPGVNVSVNLEMNGIANNVDSGIRVHKGAGVRITGNDIFYSGRPFDGSAAGHGIVLLSPNPAGLSITGNYIGWNEGYGIYSPLRGFNQISQNVIACNGLEAMAPGFDDVNEAMGYPNGRHYLSDEEIDLVERGKMDPNDRPIVHDCRFFDFYGQRSGGLPAVPTAGR